MSEFPVLELVTSIKLIFLELFLSDRYEAILADNVDFPDPEFPKQKYILEFINLEKSLEANFLASCLKKLTRPSSKFFPIKEWLSLLMISG